MFLTSGLVYWSGSQVASWTASGIIHLGCTQAAGLVFIPSLSQNLFANCYHLDLEENWGKLNQPTIGAKAYPVSLHQAFWQTCYTHIHSMSSPSSHLLQGSVPSKTPDIHTMPVSRTCWHHGLLGHRLSQTKSNREQINRDLNKGSWSILPFENSAASHIRKRPHPSRLASASWISFHIFARQTKRGWSCHQETSSHARKRSWRNRTRSREVCCNGVYSKSQKTSLVGAILFQIELNC